MTGRLPLAGIRIVDFTLIWAGPYGVAMLAALGAEVIRVESCHHHITNTRGFVAKPTKAMMPLLAGLTGSYADKDPKEDPWNRHAMFNHLGRDRYSMTVDLRRPEGRDVVYDLIKISDIIFDNNNPATLPGLGLDYKTIHALNPTLIYMAMPVYGFSGPYKDYIGFGSNAEAIAGFALLRSYLDGDVSTSGGSNHMDATSGVGAAYAALMAIYERDRTGRGQLIEFCQIEHLIHQVGGPLMDAAMNGRDQKPIGNRDAVRAPQGVYRCAGDDRWIAVTVGTDAEWSALCQAMGRPELADDPRYQGNLARQARHDELDGLISEWTRDKDSIKLMHELQGRGIPAGITATDKDCYEDPHLEARGFFKWVDHPAVGRRRLPTHPVKLLGTPMRYDKPSPLLGEHNDLVYREMLGKSDAEIKRLTELGHIGTAYSEEAIRTG